MRLLRKFLSSAWTGFAILAVCVGFIADFPVGRSELEDSVNAIFPVGAASLPYLALGGVIYGGGLIVRWISRTSADLLHGGPSVRRFQSLSRDIGTCNRLLVNHLEGFHPSSEAYSKTARETELNIEINLLLDGLQSLGIPVPDFGQVGNEERLRFLVAYLTAMETLARSGNLKHAQRSDLVDQLRRQGVRR